MARDRISIGSMAVLYNKSSFGISSMMSVIPCSMRLVALSSCSERPLPWSGWLRQLTAETIWSHAVTNWGGTLILLCSCSFANAKMF